MGGCQKEGGQDQNMADLSKEARIKNEKIRLKKIFKNIDENKFNTLEGVMDKAAFMRIMLDEMEKQIIDQGWDDEYQNGETQKGTKASPAAQLHLSMTKNYLAAMKLLVESAPPAERKNSKLAAMRAESEDD